MINPHEIDIYAAENLLATKKGIIARKWLSRKYSRKDRRRILIFYNHVETAPAQIFPFYYYWNSLDRRFSAETRCVDISNITGHIGKYHPYHNLIKAADIILIQPWFTIGNDKIKEILEGISAINSNASMSFLDSYAHSDIRLARAVNPYIKYYIKKSLFRDKQSYFRKFGGGTILDDYYDGLYEIDSEKLDWNVPGDIIPKLRLSPNFLTAARFVRMFRTGGAPKMDGKLFDVQARIGTKGSPWYQAMRNDALRKIEGIAGLRVSPKTKVSRAEFMKELSASKLCFSPFGYGELCWRDIEAMATGAILIKPNMDHLETLPDLYQAGVTYLPCRWDFSDLENIVHNALSNYEKHFECSINSYDICRDYINNDKFINDISFIFDE